MSKQDLYPPKPTIVDNDYATGVDSTGPSTIRILMSAILNYVWTLAKIPAGATSPITRDAYTTLPFVANGLVWTADSAGVNKNASMTSGVVFINGRFITITAVSGRTFTASDDTYVDVLDNGDGTGTLVYTLVANNAASPALAANSIRIAIIVCGATFIVSTAASINQGQFSIVLPIASSIPYVVTDSIGNLICCRDPANKVIGYRQIVADYNSATNPSDITGLNLNCIIPANRKVRVTGFTGLGSSSVANNAVIMALLDVTAGVTLASAEGDTNASGDTATAAPFRLYDGVAAGARNFKAQLSHGTNAATAHTNSSTTNPSYIMVELE